MKTKNNYSFPILSMLFRVKQINGILFKQIMYIFSWQRARQIRLKPLLLLSLIFFTPIVGQCQCPNVTIVNGTGNLCTGEGGPFLASWFSDILSANTVAIADSTTNYPLQSTVLVPSQAAGPDGLTASGVHSGVDMCVSEEQVSHMYLDCYAPGGTSWLYLGTHTLTVFPEVQAPIISTTDCSVTVTGFCSSDIVTLSGQSISGGTISNNGTNSVTYTAAYGDLAGTVNISINSGIAGNTCSSYTSMTVTPACAMCPNVTIVNGTGNLCTDEGGPFLASWFADIQSANATAIADSITNFPAQSTVLVPSQATGPNGITATGVHSGIDMCVSEEQVTHMYLDCYAPGGTSWLYLGTHTLTVFPEVQAPIISTTDCSVTVTGFCSSDIVTLSGQSGSGGTITNNGTNSVTYTAAPGNIADTINISISSGIIGNTCLQYTSSIITPFCPSNLDSDGDGIEDSCDDFPLISNIIFTSINDIPNDWKCGNKNKKVRICHIPPGNPSNAKSSCVSENAVAAHLAHGDYLGECITCANSSLIQNKEFTTKVFQKNHELKLTPNPTTDFVNVSIPEHFNQTDSHLTVYSLTGQQVYNQKVVINERTIMLRLNNHNIESGVYIVVLSSENESTSEKLVITR